MSTLYSPKYNIEFYHITKNGMMTTIKTLKLEWTPITELPPNRRILCVLRHPIDRSISSFQHILKIYKSGNYGSMFRKLTKNKINEMFCNTDVIKGFERYVSEIMINGFFDTHNIPQTFYLTNQHRNVCHAKSTIADRRIEDITDFLETKRLSGQLKEITNDNRLGIVNRNRTKNQNIAKRINNFINDNTLLKENII